MKKITLFISLFAITNIVFGQTNKIIFNEDFENSILRLGSQYVPQSGKDNDLGKFNHGSSFYQLANTYYTTSPSNSVTLEKANQDVWNIDNGYYAVIAPKSIYSFPDNPPNGSIPWKGTFWRKIQNNTNATDNGAVLVVNGGVVLNQYYRRVVVLEPGKSYKISAWFYGSGNNNVGVNFEAQNISTEEILGSSNKDLGITNFENWSNNVMRLTNANTWEQKSWTFKTPDSKTCSSIAIALRNNVKADSGNDFYVDDIILEEVTEGGNVIDCSESPEVDAIIKANDDAFVLIGNTDNIFNIISNDSYNDEIGKVILSGRSKNSTIAIIDTWPDGITLNTETGEIIVTKGTPAPTEPLRYQICNTLGACSTALVTITGSFQSTCTQKPTLGIPKGYSNVGISTYSENENFPTSIPNGFLALQSSKKGFVISRTTSNQITQPIEGIIIYDTTDKCVKLFNGSNWNCIQKTCN